MAALESSPQPIELPLGYYRDNFQIVLDRVRSVYEDLLTPRESEVLAIWPTLSLASQRLLVRLLTRKGVRFRLSKLQYAEIGCSLTAATDLASAGLIALNPPLKPADYLPLFSKAECLARLQHLLPAHQSLVSLRSLSRQALDRALMDLLGDISSEQFCAEALLELIDWEWFEAFKLLFFGRPGQDLSEFVVRDLGHVRFENYQIDKSLRVFSARTEIDTHLSLHRYCEQAELAIKADALVLQEWLRGLPAVADDDVRGRRRWQRVALAGARQLERLGEHSLALEYYVRCSMPPARERRVRILSRDPHTLPQALALAAEMAATPYDEAEAEISDRLGKRLARQLQQPWPPIAAKTAPKLAALHKPAEEQLALPWTDLSVELAAAAALSASGPCFYVENALFNTIFGLLYWPALFAPVRGAFAHAFQTAPLDLFEEGFCSARTEWLQAIDSQLADPTILEPLLRQRWRDKFGIACPFVAWELFEHLPISLALQTIPAPHWRAIFQRFLNNLREHRSGLPDLIQFPHSGGYRLLEVKGPGDRLQANQLRWMRYFAEHGIAHGVIHVTWLNAAQPQLIIQNSQAGE